MDIKGLVNHDVGVKEPKTRLKRLVFGQKLFNDGPFKHVSQVNKVMATGSRLSEIIGVALALLVQMPQPANAFEARLIVDGPDALRDALTSASLILDARDEDVSDPQVILAAALSDYRQLLGTLYKRGYYSGVISITIDGNEAAGFSQFATPALIDTIEITVDPGPPFTFARTQLTPSPPGNGLDQAFQTGARARSGVISDVAETAIGQWRDIGFATAKVSKQSIIADHRRRSLAVDIVIDPGPKLTFGTFSAKGSQTVRQERIEAIAGYPQGEVFSPAALEKVRKRLQRSGAFRSVAIVEEAVAPDGTTLPITAQLADAPPRRFGFGAEISSLEGATVSAFWLHRNLLGGAERLRIDGQVAGVFAGGDMDYNLGARLDRPATFGPDIGLYTTFEFEELNQSDYFLRKVEADVGASAIVNDNLIAEAGVGLRYSEVEDDFGTRTFRHAVLPISATYDGRDSVLNPTTGQYLSADFLPYLGLGGSQSGVRISADMRRYTRLGQSGDVILAGRLQVGSVIGSDVSATPPDLLFYSGGGGTVRGQAFQSLGIETGGIKSGGRSLLALSLELRAKLSSKLQVVTFLDGGIVGENSLTMAGGDSHTGGGVGLRYMTGVGPIRLDVATPLSGDAGGGLQFYVGIGQAF